MCCNALTKITLHTPRLSQNCAGNYTNFSLSHVHLGEIWSPINSVPVENRMYTVLAKKMRNHVYKYKRVLRSLSGAGIQLKSAMLKVKLHDCRQLRCTLMQDCSRVLGYWKARVVVLTRTGVCSREMLSLCRPTQLEMTQLLFNIYLTINYNVSSEDCLVIAPHDDINWNRRNWSFRSKFRASSGACLLESSLGTARSYGAVQIHKSIVLLLLLCSRNCSLTPLWITRLLWNIH